MSTLNRIEAPPCVEDAGAIDPRRVAGLLLATYVALVALIVFWPTTEMNNASVGGIWTVLHALGAPLWITPSRIEFATNVVLFMPLSFLGSALESRLGWRGWLVSGFGGSLLIELTQLVFLSGRVPSISDVAANTLGAAVGYVLFTLVRRTGAWESFAGGTGAPGRVRDPELGEGLLHALRQQALTPVRRVVGVRPEEVATVREPAGRVDVRHVMGRRDFLQGGGKLRR